MLYLGLGQADGFVIILVEGYFTASEDQVHRNLDTTPASRHQLTISTANSGDDTCEGALFSSRRICCEPLRQVSLML